MADAFYDRFKYHLGRGEIALHTANFRLLFVDAADYTEDMVNDDALDDIPAGARVAESGNLASVTYHTVAAGVLDADNGTISSVSGDEFEKVVLFVETGTESTSYLCIRWDSATGLPGTPNGGDWDWTFNASGICKV